MIRAPLGTLLLDAGDMALVEDDSKTSDFQLLFTLSHQDFPMSSYFSQTAAGDGETVWAARGDGPEIIENIDHQRLVKTYTV